MDRRLLPRVPVHHAVGGSDFRPGSSGICLVGETTRGGAHAGVFHRIDNHFGVGIPEQKAINPFGNADWEGVGVEPDVKVNASDALTTAVKLSKATLERK